MMWISDTAPIVHEIDPTRVGDRSKCGRAGPVVWASTGSSTCADCRAGMRVE